MNKIGMGERAPWGAFPKVVRNGDLGALQDEPEYLAAKGGDREAALNLVDRLVTDDTVSQIKAIIGNDRPLLVPVLAVEDAGNTALLIALAATGTVGWWGWLGVVPLGELTRRYVDEAGWLHQAIAERCQRVILTVAGLPLYLKGTES